MTLLGPSPMLSLLFLPIHIVAFILLILPSRYFARESPAA
jgi:hypothetical protein